MLLAYFRKVSADKMPILSAYSRLTAKRFLPPEAPLPASITYVVSKKSAHAYKWAKTIQRVTAGLVTMIQLRIFMVMICFTFTYSLLHADCASVYIFIT